MTYYVCGLIPVGNVVLREEYPLVQARCHYDVLDVYTIAELVQDYYSNATLNRDVEYVFPLPPSAAVCSFKAVIDDDKVIKGIVKEKGEAKREYQEAVSQGKTAGLLQQEHADVFRVSLGNIRPKQKISVHISFVSIIPHDGSSPQSLRITMPTAIAPRYGTAPTHIPWFGKNGGNRFELTVAVQMNKPVTSVSSPSHPIGLTLGCAEKELKGDYEPSKAFVHLGDSAFLDKDIVVIISSQGLDVPRCTVERWLASEGAEETTDAYALTLVPKFDLPALPSQEYIFLVDRSGSMGGGRMESVKTGLQIMLKSLPSRNTTFNIVSFGSRYTSLWPKAQVYSAETVAEASGHVDTMTANYGGTELRSALEFAFDSRLSLKGDASEKTLPTSVLVLTDGEAWDLDGIFNLVTSKVEETKKQDNLLRTFVLGVGNQVSTAMCEGIARAGKGSTVFVAEGEKPDAKLMSLLKAARGGVIENLSVDWGASIEEPKVIEEADDDFEMVPESSGSKAELPPLGLFEEETPSTENADLGPQKMIVQLPPPPVIQQAPKSDKLPIPLYPGFRCSIFAIVKQSSNPGPHSPSVKITGKVMGRAVAFSIPVTPVAIGSTATAKAMESGKLLHTLAAKALIQLYEGMPSTPESKAQIERLGKRYSLTSSVTAFLAIDHESVLEVHIPDVRNMEAIGVGKGIKVLGSPSPMLAYPSSYRVGSSLQRPSPATSTLRSGSSLSTFAAPLPAASPMGYIDVAKSLEQTTQAMRDNISGVLERGEKLDSLASRTESLSNSSEQFRRKSAGGRGGWPGAGTHSFFGGSPRARDSSPPSAPSPLPPAPAPQAQAAPPNLSGRVFSAPRPPPPPRGLQRQDLASHQYSSASPLVPSMASSSPSGAGPTSLTLESIARAQQFDGSFPHDIAFLASIRPKQPVPAIPASLGSLNGDTAVKDRIWATLLTLVCLKRVFAAEKDSWEVMAEKATAFVVEELNSMGVEGSALSATLMTAAESQF